MRSARADEAGGTPDTEPWPPLTQPQRGDGVSGWTARLLSTLIGRLPRRKRVVVGSERRTGTLDPTLFGERRPGAHAGLVILDPHRLDGQLMERLRTEAPDEVYFDLGAGIDEQMMSRVGAGLLMDGVTVHFVLPQPGRPPLRAEAAWIGSHSIISLHAVADGLGARAMRRMLDVLGAGLLLLLLAPLMGAVMALVWWKMGRPILHMQQRLGRAGRLFPLYKFRSMVPDAETRLRASPEVYERYVAGNFKLPVDEDPRITPLGRVLRRTSLDELPQLWNVLCGDMSLVGPRAIVPEEKAEYGDYARMLLRFKPGLTGLWQVSGRSQVGYPERARLDLQYLESRSLRKDLQILLRTLPVVILQRGAV